MATTIEHCWRVQLLRHWELVCDGKPTPIGGFARRAVAGIALAGPASLEQIAELLLPGRPCGDSAGSLGAEVDRLRRELPGLLDESEELLALAPGVWVDLTELLGAADRRSAMVHGSPQLIGELRDAELLPGWVEDWAQYHRELVRMFRLATLEAIARYGLRLDNPATAAAAARSSAAIEPLSESSHALLIRALVLAGNLREAFFVHEDFRCRLLEQTGAEPRAHQCPRGAVGNSPRRRASSSSAHRSRSPKRRNNTRRQLNMALDNTDGFETARISRHGGRRTWWTGCVRFFRRWGQHPRHSAGTEPTRGDDPASGSN